MIATREIYERAAEYVEIHGLDRTGMDWGEEMGPCCVGGAVMMAAAKLREIAVTLPSKGDDE